MDSINFKIQLDLKETEIVMFALKYELRDTIDNHIMKLQNHDISHRRGIFFEQNAEKLTLLKNLSGMFPSYSNQYQSIIYHLNENLPEVKNEQI